MEGSQKEEEESKEKDHENIEPEIENSVWPGQYYRQTDQRGIKSIQKTEENLKA